MVVQRNVLVGRVDSQRAEPTNRPRKEHEIQSSEPEAHLPTNGGRWQGSAQKEERKHTLTKQGTPSSTRQIIGGWEKKEGEPIRPEAPEPERKPLQERVREGA